MERTRRTAAAVEDYGAGLTPEQVAILDALREAVATAVADAIRRLRAVPQGQAGREYAIRTLAQRNAVASLEGLGRHVSPRTLAGAVRDAGDLGWYATPADYQMALLGFIADRQRHARIRLPAVPSPA
ncbi:MAG: hypothetical protein ACYDAN_02505 [Candidatus Limnocylindrales bacterium]